jgi:hypothetical protein
MRAIEALIAIVMILASFQVFLNFEIQPATMAGSTRQTGYDMLNAYKEAVPLALWDFFAFDQFVTYSVPDNFNFKLSADFFTPITASPEENTQTLAVDFASGVDPASIYLSDSSSEIVPSQADFNYYRVPFYVTNLGDSSASIPLYVSFSLPPLDGNGDMLSEPADRNSLDLYFDGKRVPFILHYLQARNTTLLPTVLFNTSLLKGQVKQGYLYFSTGTYSRTNIPVKYAPLNTTRFNVSIGSRPIEKIPRATVKFRPNVTEPTTLFISSKVGYLSEIKMDYSSNLSYSNATNYFVLNNSRFYLNVSRDGNYSFHHQDGTALFFAMPSLGSPAERFTLDIPPRLMNQSKAIGSISVYWQINSTSARVDYFATIFEGTDEILVQRKMVPVEMPTYPVEFSYSLDIISLNGTLSYSSTPVSTWPNKPTGILNKRSFVFSNATHNLSIFTDELVNITTAPNLVRLEGVANLTEETKRLPIFSQTLYKYREGVVLPNDRPANFFGSDEYFFDTSPYLVLAGLGTTMTFPHMVALGRPDEYSLNFTVARRFNLTLNLSCSLSDGASERLVFTDLTIPSYIYVNDSSPKRSVFRIPASWLSNRDAFFICSVNETNITISGITITPLKFSTMEGALRVPVVFRNPGAGRADVVFRLPLSDAGIEADSGPSAFRVIDPVSHDSLDFAIDSGTLFFYAQIPANSEKTYEIILSPDYPLPESVVAEEMVALVPDGTPEVSLSDPGSLEIELGKARTSSRVYYAPPMSNPGFVDRSIGPNAEATVSQKFVIDPESGRTASIKLVLWRKS